MTIIGSHMIKNLWVETSAQTPRIFANKYCHKWSTEPGSQGTNRGQTTPQETDLDSKKLRVGEEKKELSENFENGLVYGAVCIATTTFVQPI